MPDNAAQAGGLKIIGRVVEAKGSPAFLSHAGSIIKSCIIPQFQIVIGGI
ncbi:hypothetical protein TRIP_C20119 [Candidatus Zixiibacteriota bacterium]|nr:hypothetical protein TRIP_C20119 [candidate division Zixibacteria bacterium]